MKVTKGKLGNVLAARAEYVRLAADYAASEEGVAVSQIIRDGRRELAASRNAAMADSCGHHEAF